MNIGNIACLENHLWLWHLAKKKHVPIKEDDHLGQPLIKQ